MKGFACLLLTVITTLIMLGNAAAQDDETRQQTGLPTLATGRKGENLTPGFDATVSGVVVVQGLGELTTVPPLTVVILANATVIERRRVQNRGTFRFTNIPRFGVTLILEADNQEVARYALGNLNPPPLDNHQDIVVTSTQIGQVIKSRNEVLTVLNSYQRTDENQKLFERAVNAVREKKNDDALKLFKQLAVTDPGDFVTWTEVGDLYFSGEKYGDAETAYNKALVLKPDFSLALLNLGKLFLAQKKYDAAIETLSKAVALAPESADANQDLGEAYLRARKGSKAVGYLNKALELAPVEKAEIHLRLAALYNAANLKDRAVNEYKLFLSKVPNYSEKATIEKYIKDNSPK